MRILPRILLVTTFALTLLHPARPVGAAATHARTTPAAQKQTDAQGFASFWSKFKAALARGDRAAVASMTKLPFLFEGRELDRAGFLRRFDALFDRRTKRCFARGKPTRDGDSYSLFCGETIYLFARVGGEYRFTEIGVND